jgi:hypothetical protein
MQLNANGALVALRNLPMFAIIIAPLAVIGSGLAFFAWRLSVDIHREKQFRSELSGSGFQHTLS